MTGEESGTVLPRVTVPPITEYLDLDRVSDAGITPAELGAAMEKQAQAIRDQLGFTDDEDSHTDYAEQDDTPERSAADIPRDTEQPPAAQSENVATFPQQELRLDAMDALQENGLAVEDPWDIAPTYSTREYEGAPLDPIGVKSTVLTAFLDFCDREISEKRRDKLRWIDHILEQPENIDFDRAADWYERPDAVDFDRFNADVFADDPGFELRKTAKPYDPEAYWDELRESTDRIETQVLDAATADLVDTMHGLAQAKDDTFKDRVDRFDQVFDRYDPDVYTELLENDHEYTVRTYLSRDAMQAVAATVDSCLADRRFYRVFDGYEDDPFTVFQAIARDGMTRGYTRSFLLEDSDGDMFLGLDTIEVPLKDGKKVPKEEYKAFETNQDIVRAGALAAVQTGLDLGVKYVAARDTRIRYGAKDGYSGTKRSITYEKPGSAVQSYVVSDSTMVHPGVRKLEQSAGDQPFVEDLDDIEIRGFDTVAEHETDAYLLFENPLYTGKA